MFKGQQIVKYPNRKYYSVTESRYMNFNEIADLFHQGCGFIVRDRRTNEDLTVTTLVKALSRTGHFDRVVEERNLKNIEKNLKLAGISVHG